MDLLLLLKKCCGDPGFTECHLAHSLFKIIMPILLVIGTVGNVLNIAILSRRRMRKYPITIFLLFLAGSDLTFIWTVSLRHMLLSWRGIDILELTSFSCTVHKFVAFSAGMFSNSILALLTVDRVLFTIQPALAKQKLTNRNVFIIILFTLVTIASITGHLLFGSTLNEIEIEISGGNQTTVVSVPSCTYTSLSYKKFYLFSWRYIVLFLTIIPFIVILVGNGVIVWKLMAQRRKVQPIPQPQTQGSDDKIQIATKMMFILSAAFVCTTIPYCIFMTVQSNVGSEVGANQFAQLQLGYAVVVNLLQFNYAFNFVLYCISGSNFRQEGMAMKKDIGKFFRDKLHLRRNNGTANIVNTLNTRLEMRAESSRNTNEPRSTIPGAPNVLEGNTDH